MKVLMLTHEFPPSSIGGIGTFCHNLANSLARSGVELTVVAGSSPGQIKTGCISNTATNFDLIRVPKLDFPPSHLWYQLMNLSSLRRLISGFDIVHGQDSSSFPMVYLSKRKYPEIPWVVTVHDGPVSEFYYALKSLGRGGSLRDFARYGIGFPAWDTTLRGDAKFADALVPVSENLSLEIKRSYQIAPSKAFTIHTGVDTVHLASIARANTSDCPTSGKTRLFWAGRLSWRKGIVHLLNSLAYLVGKIGFRDFELQVFGRGPLERRAKELVSGLNLSGNVRLRGFVEYEELIAAMASSDIVCFPSLYEACPLGMIEAMALGRPLAVFDRPFSREILGDSLELSPVRGIEDYAEMLHMLCTSEDLRKKMGVRLQSRAQEKFDIRMIAQRYSKLYQDILDYAV